MARGNPILIPSDNTDPTFPDDEFPDRRFWLAWSKKLVALLREVEQRQSLQEGRPINPTFQLWHSFLIQAAELSIDEFRTSLATRRTEEP